VAKPTRRDLLVTLTRVQDLIGAAQGATYNDRIPDRSEAIRAPLATAFELCMAARAFDPPVSLKRMRAKR
jgi:hypothetical protein